MKSLIIPDSVLVSLHASSKKQVLQELSHKAASLLDMPEREILEALMEREKLGSTGIGKGIAIPHCRLPGLTRVAGIFAKLDPAVEFESVDSQPVDLVFLLMAPTSAGADHLRALATISRCLRNENTCAKLRGTSTPDAIHAILLEDV
ncbi:MAG: PTS IIA-like nitrogen-regulatory protein PtsN [Alphaproteobacteria bacterium GWF2_58_20]|nr:MAG: PTS IIA-like nitrogen-regulatory protein PtsN [Alphaproteobacteria bacterium GWF2_58_20]